MACAAGQATLPPHMLVAVWCSPFWREAFILERVPLCRHLWIQPAEAVAGANTTPRAERALASLGHTVLDLGLPLVGVLTPAHSPRWVRHGQR